MVIPYTCLLAVLAFLVVQSLQLDNAHVTLLSLVSSAEKEDACLGEFITFTCTGYNASFLQWKLTNRNGSWRSSPFYENDITKTEILNGFKANIAGDTNDTGRGKITLQLSAYVQLEMTETTIECLTVSVNGKISKQTELIVEDYSTPPTNLSSKLQDVIMTLDQVLLVTWIKAATPHSLYNCTVVQLSGEAPGHHVTNVLTEDTRIVLLLRCEHNYSVSVTATSPTSKCSSQPQSLSVDLSTLDVCDQHLMHCATPMAPNGGTIDYHMSSNVGAVAGYSCYPWLEPNISLVSVCLTSGLWFPNPAEHVCKEPLTRDASINFIIGDNDTIHHCTDVHVLGELNCSCGDVCVSHVINTTCHTAQRSCSEINVLITVVLAGVSGACILFVVLIISSGIVYCCCCARHKSTKLAAPNIANSPVTSQEVGIDTYNYQPTRIHNSLSQSDKSSKEEPEYELPMLYSMGNSVPTETETVSDTMTPFESTGAYDHTYLNCSKQEQKRLTVADIVVSSNISYASRCT